MNTTLMRLDHALVARQLVTTRSQATSYIKLGMVHVDGTIVTKPGYQVHDDQTIVVEVARQYVSRAALKLDSASRVLSLDFAGKTVLDVGSSTGGFTDYALQHGAAAVIAVDVGTDQLHPSLRKDQRIELHEKTDIRDFSTTRHIDIVVADVSFISLREVLPAIRRISASNTEIIVMVKPQFEARQAGVKHRGVIKNDTMRRKILKDFERWVQVEFLVLAKADSEISGAKGNTERFYTLKPRPAKRAPKNPL